MIRLQKVIFPTCLDSTQDLYYRAEQNIETDQDLSMCISSQYMRFDTYFNMFSLTRWKTHTYIKNVFLSLTIEGKCHICLYGLTGKEEEILLAEYTLNNPVMEKVEIPFPKTDCLMLFWTIHKEERFKLKEAYYSTDTPETDKNDVRLAIICCTFKREHYILNNLEQMAALPTIYPELKDKIDVYVIDNGQTLAAEQMPSSNFHLFPNINAGGSGGFARGMLEVLYRGDAHTHALLMDDDVEIISESFFRAWSFLSLCREESRHSFLGGAMLDMLKSHIQHESEAAYGGKYIWLNLKASLDLRKRHNCLHNDIPSMNTTGKRYQGWWFCIIPVEYIRKYLLPYPFFVRNDDIEYAIRSNVNIIYLNGICIWHEPFYAKDHISFPLFYLANRNNMILSLLKQEYTDNKHSIITLNLKSFVKLSLIFNYNAIDLMCSAIEDVSRGSSAVKHSDCYKDIFKIKNTYSDKFTSLKYYNGYDNIPLNIDSMEHTKSLTIMQKIVCIITFNGHLLPSFLRQGRGISLADGKNRMSCYFLRSEMLVINRYDRTATQRHCSLAELIRVTLRFARAMFNYIRKIDNLKKDYSSSYAEMISPAFWEQHLGLTNSLELKQKNTNCQ